MFKAEDLERFGKRLDRGIFWTAALILPLTLGGSWLALQWPEWIGWLLMPLLLGAFAGGLWVFSKIIPRCPVCNGEVIPRKVLPTGRCRNCRSVIVDRVIVPDPEIEYRRTRNAFYRMLCMLALFAAATPFGALGMAARGMVAPNQNVWSLTAGLWGFYAFFAVGFAFNLRTIRLEKERKQEDVQLDPPYPRIAVMGVHGWHLRRYLVYLAPARLCFACVDGGRDEILRAVSHTEIAQFFSRAIEKARKRRRRMQAVYDSVDPASDELLVIHADNFQIGREQLVSWEYLARHRTPRARRKKFFAYPGVLVLRRVDEPELRLAMMDELSEEEVLERMRAWEAMVEI